MDVLELLVLLQVLQELQANVFVMVVILEVQCMLLERGEDVHLAV